MKVIYYYFFSSNFLYNYCYFFFIFFNFFFVDLKIDFQTREGPHHEHLYHRRYPRPHNQHVHGQVLTHIPSGGALVNAPTGRMFIHLQHMFSFWGKILFHFARAPPFQNNVLFTGYIIKPTLAVTFYLTFWLINPCDVTFEFRITFLFSMRTIQLSFSLVDYIKFI